MIWEIFVYPVSGVMKLWYLGLHHLVGLDSSHAWIGSIFGLILTVRGLITPLSYLQYRNNRVLTNLRPTMRALRDETKYSFDPQAMEKYNKAQKELYKEHNYSVAKGCWPALIQTPAFLGLYRVLILMARPADGLEAEHHQPIGMLTSEDVSGFIQARINDVPTVAYIAMSPEQFDYLQTSHDVTRATLAPLFVLAAIFTTINMAYSVVRNRITLDHESKLSMFFYWLMIGLVLFVPYFTLSFGFRGPAPAAIALYWFANNLWTMSQFILLNLWLDKTYPFTQEFKDFRDGKKAEVKARNKLWRKFKRRRWGRRAHMTVMPWKYSALHTKNKEDKAETLVAMHPESPTVDRIRRKRRELEKEYRRQKSRLDIAKKKAEKAGEPWPPEHLVEKGVLTEDGEFTPGYFLPSQEEMDAIAEGREYIPAGDDAEDAETLTAEEALTTETVKASKDFEWLGSYPLYPTSKHR